MVALCWFVCIPIVGREYVIAGLPPLTGCIVAATMMQTAAMEKGLITAAVLAIAMYAVQGFVGYPHAICLKLEGRRLLASYRRGEMKGESEANTEMKEGAADAAISGKMRIFPRFRKNTDHRLTAKLDVSRPFGKHGGKAYRYKHSSTGAAFRHCPHRAGLLERDSLRKADLMAF